MATDGGNNTVAFNPFELRIIRVVDPAGNQLRLDVVSPATDISEVGRRHLEHGQARHCARPPDGRSGVGELRTSPPWCRVYALKRASTTSPMTSWPRC